jgi:uncharacterized UBP type Zn finger protein
MTTHMAWQHIKKESCPHLAELNEEISSDKTTCEVCGEKNDLRICMTCGAVHCCESHSAHDTEHFRTSGHPFIKPHRMQYNWLWCYKCNAFLD